LVKIKESPPYSPELEGPVLLNSLARANLDLKTGSYSFSAKLDRAVKMDMGNVEAVKGIIGQAGNVAGVGVDQGEPFAFTADAPAH
jgi:fatty acid synthase subunit alpha, fungi type